MIVFPAPWFLPPFSRTLAINSQGFNSICDFWTCYTVAAVVEPPSTSVIISALGSRDPISPIPNRPIPSVIPVICENQMEMCYSLGWKHHIASSIMICVFGASTQTIRKVGAILGAEWSQCELKSWWRTHLLNQVKPISLWRRSPWSNPRKQRIPYHFCQSGWLSICKSCWSLQ